MTDRLSSELFQRLFARVTISPDTRETSSVKAPFTGEPIADVPLCRAEDVDLAIKRARLAQTSWATTPYKKRAEVVLRFHDMVLDQQEEILDLIQLESGKARRHALEEVLDAAIVSRHYAFHGEKLLQPTRRRGALPALTATWEHHHPLGVVAFISPWNYPFSLAVTDAIPALLAGNAVVLKPDQLTPFSALYGVELLDKAGLPQDLFQVVTGRGRELGKPLIQQSNYICFTGSTETGRSIAQQAGAALIDCSLELGGKNPMIVLDDAPLNRALDGGVRACFTNSGQLCISVERLYVQEGIYERFVPAFIELVRSMKLSAGFDYETEMGSLISQEQFDKIKGHVDDAVSKGATIAAGGKARPDLGPLFYEPTVLTGVTETMKVAREETFGPVVSIYKFASTEQAVSLANDTLYGLNASIWTGNTEAGRRLALQIQAGTVNINEAYAAAWASVDAPMGGFKQSGLGRRHGDYGILKYTEPQTVAVQRLIPIAPSLGMTQESYARNMIKALRVLRRSPGVR
ncbi:MAG: succinate-semialdehyde dehydrogenase (NADP(+)) [Deltaproteobacteria bacterium]|nr:succinate-semialdehyde dehydrogenase (NADP(+)) [Deltaproteobacteria bacterium]